MTLESADIRRHLCQHLVARSIYRGHLAAAYPDDWRNGESSATLSAWSKELAAYPDDSPELAALVALAQETGTDTAAAACEVMGLGPEVASRVGFHGGVLSLSELLQEWSTTAARSLHDEGG